LIEQVVCIGIHKEQFRATIGFCDRGIARKTKNVQNENTKIDIV
jgi:hypothetical protein